MQGGLLQRLQPLPMRGSKRRKAGRIEARRRLELRIWRGAPRERLPMGGLRARAWAMSVPFLDDGSGDLGSTGSGWCSEHDLICHLFEFDFDDS
jgi:hypothetical protein